MIEDFFQKVLELKNIPRQGWKEKLGINNPESVADHSYSTTVMSMILSDLEGLNSEKIIRMALLHDLAESVIGDIIPNDITKNEKISKEDVKRQKTLLVACLLVFQLKKDVKNYLKTTQKLCSMFYFIF